jgi:hypothetical protein
MQQRRRKMWKLIVVAEIVSGGKNERPESEEKAWWQT